MSILESALCLDRRVSGLTGVHSAGTTTWTLPYPVPTDGSKGRVVVVRLDTATELTVTRPSTTTVAAVGNFSAVSCVVGLAHQFRFVPSTIYARGAGGEPDRRVPVRLSYVRAYLSGTRALDGTVTVSDVGSWTIAHSETTPSEGQALSLPVFTDSRQATLEFVTDSPFPVRIGSLEWEGQFDPLAATQVP